MIPAHSGTVTLTDGARAVTVPLPAEASPDPLEATHAAWRALAGGREPNLSPAAAVATMRAIEAEGSFTFTTSTMTIHRRSPPIGALRRWARATSRTPWHSRSIASWRWAWREAHAMTATVMAWGWSS